MAKILQDIWIISADGIVVYSRVFDEKINEQLFGALMSAINSFAEEISKNSLSNFELQNIRFSIVKKNRFLFIANSNKKIKDKKVISELDKISDKFFQLYSDQLKNWDNDISIFEGFETTIKSALEERMESFWDDF